MSVIYDKNYDTSVQENLVKRSVNLRDKIFTNAKLSPLFMLLQAKGRTMPETNQKFEWLETRLNKPTFKVAPNNNSATDLTVVTDDSSVTFLTEGSIIKDIKTHEQMRVTAVNGKTITVVRGYGVQPLPLFARAGPIGRLSPNFVLDTDVGELKTNVLWTKKSRMTRKM